MTLGGLGGGGVHAGRAAADAMVVSASTALNSFQYRSAASSTPQLHNTIASVFGLLVNASLLARAALTGKHDTLVRRAPGWQGAPDGQQAKN